MVADLRAAVIIDYQNVHLTGHGQFDSTRDGPKHEALVDPLHFAHQLLQVRNSRQCAGHERAVLRYLDMFRGEPSPDHEAKAHARNQAQKAQWERDKRVAVTLRPLKYRYQRRDWPADHRSGDGHQGSLGSASGEGRRRAVRARAGASSIEQRC